jgi:hypothetical protein
VERLSFLDVMFGDRPALSPPEIFYQRMLVGDPSEAAEKAEEFLKARSLSSFYDQVALKGLQLAQADLERGALDAVRLTRIRDTVNELASDLADQADREPIEVAQTEDAEAVAAIEDIPPEDSYRDAPVLAATELAPGWRGDRPVLCVGARTALDEAAAILLAQLSNAHGLPARVEGPDALSTANLFRLEDRGTAMVCLSYLAVDSPAHVRFAVKRLRRKLPRARIMVGCWGQDAARAHEIGEAAKAEFSATSLRQAIEMAVLEAKNDSAADMKETSLASHG